MMLCDTGKKYDQLTQVNDVPEISDEYQPSDMWSD